MAGVAKPFSIPLSIDINASPENTRRRNKVNCDGLAKSLIPM